MSQLLKMLNGMRHSPIRNYAGVPGLTSWLVGEQSSKGTVRLMECSRQHYEAIIPHSHRFDFHCQVLRGRVRNMVWTPGTEADDRYQATVMEYGGAPGKYKRGAVGGGGYKTTTTEYKAGFEYSMKANEIHSIYFDRDTTVLFLEGPSITQESVILEPIVEGVVVPTFDVKDWMFQRPGV